MSELEKLIYKATDGSLTNDNWQYILDVCDCISSNPETNTKEAITIVQKRLAMKDANVILRALSLLLAIAENCGSRMKQEIASSSFLQESLLKKLGDRKLHKQVKFRIAEVIVQLNSSFDNDPSLKPIKDAFKILKSKYGHYINSPPNKPEKQELSTSERKNEEMEMERALKLSVQEYEREQSIKKSYLNSKPLPSFSESGVLINPSQTERQEDVISSNTSQQRKPSSEDQQSATIASVKKVCALYDLISYEPDELSFKKGDVITVIESVYRDWWKGSLPSGKIGIFPLNYVTPVVTKSPEEISRETAMENLVQEIESKKVEKLLALLSSNPDQVPEDDVTLLYNEIIPLRSNLAKFINKYSTRKDELRVLHDKVNNETRSYNGYIDQIVGQKNHTHYTGPLPYPISSDQANPIGDQMQMAGYLEQQPTSAGFGNAYGRPVNNQFLSSNYNSDFSGTGEAGPYHQVVAPPSVQAPKYPFNG